MFFFSGKNNVFVRKFMHQYFNWFRNMSESSSANINVPQKKYWTSKCFNYSTMFNYRILYNHFYSIYTNAPHIDKYTST